VKKRLAPHTCLRRERGPFRQHAAAQKPFLQHFAQNKPQPACITPNKQDFDAGVLAVLWANG